MIKILYSDPQVVVCVKPVGVVSQCDGEEDMSALLRAELGGEFFPVHRLDRNVGGVMVFARTARAAASLSAQIQAGDFVKRYLAAVSGVPSPEEGEMRDLLFKDSRSGRSFVVAHASDQGAVCLPADATARRRQIRQPRQGLPYRALVLPAHLRPSVKRAAARILRPAGSVGISVEAV